MILPRIEKKPSTGERLAQGLVQGGQAVAQRLQQKKSQEAVANLYGEDVANLPPEMQKLYAQYAMQGKQKQAESAAKLQSDTAQKRQLEKDRQLPEGSLENYDVKTAEQVSRPQKEKNKTQASQPIDPAQLKIIKSVRETPEYKEATPLKKYQILTDNGVSKENAQAESDIAAKEVDIEEGKYKRQLEFHKEHKDYDEKLLTDYQRSIKQQESVKDIRDTLKSGNVGPNTIASIFKGTGKWGDKISEAFTNPDQAKLQAVLPQLIEGWKDVFGVRLSDADLKVIQDKLPSIGKDPKANEAILNIIDKYSKYPQMRYEIGRKIKQENKGLRPIDYANRIEDEFQAEVEKLQPVRVRDPQTGKVKLVPRDRLEEVLQSGGELLK